MRFVYRLFGVVGIGLASLWGTLHLLAAPDRLTPPALLAPAGCVITQPVTAASVITPGMPLALGDTDVTLTFAPGASGTVTATLVPTTPVNPPRYGAIERSWFITTTAENYSATATFGYDWNYPNDVVLAIDTSGSMEFDTLCYGCWTVSNTLEYPEGNRWPLPWNGPADGPPEHCAGSAPYQDNGYYYLAIEAEEYGALSNDYHRNIRPGLGYTYWVLHRNGNITEPATSYLGDTNAYGRDTRGAYLMHTPYVNYMSNASVGGVSCTWADLNNGRMCRRDSWVMAQGGPYPAPRADYDFTIPEDTAGNWYIWARVSSGDGSSDENNGHGLYWGLSGGGYDKHPIGLANKPTGTSYWHYNGAGSWTWRRLGAGNPASSYGIYLREGITYTLHLWAGSAGYAVDRLLLTNYSGTSLPGAAMAANIPLDNRRTGDACNPCDARFGGYPGGTGDDGAPNCNDPSLPEPARYRYLDDLYDDEQPMASTTKAFADFVRQMDYAQHQVGLVKYDTRAYPMHELLCLQSYTTTCELGIIENTIVSTLQKRNQVYAGGGTNIADAIEEAITLLEDVPPHRGRAEATPAIVLMTDGLPNYYSNLQNIHRVCSNAYYDDLWPGDSDAYDCSIFMAREAYYRGIVIFTITLGDGADRDLMQAIANMTGGIHLHVEDMDHLPYALDEIQNLLGFPKGPHYVAYQRESLNEPWQLFPLSQTLVPTTIGEGQWFGPQVTVSGVTTMSEWTLGPIPSIMMEVLSSTVFADPREPEWCLTIITATFLRNQWSMPSEYSGVPYITWNSSSPIYAAWTGVNWLIDYPYPGYTSALGLACLENSSRAGTIWITATVNDAALSFPVSESVTITVLPLGPNTILMEPTSTTLPADGLATTTLTATVQDRYGNMVLDGTPVTLTTNLGAVTPFTAATSDGVITATFQAGLEPGLGIVTATSEGISATLPVTLTPLPPQALALSSSAATLFADGQSTAVLTATVTDRIGNGVYESVSVTFAASHGSLAPVVQSTAHGVATATLTAPLDLVTAHITATTGTLSDTLSVAFVPAAPYTVSLVAQSASLPADGNATTILTATVTDEYGHPVAPGTLVTLTTSLGTLLSAGGTVILPARGIPVQNGMLTMMLRSSLDVGVAAITAAAGDVSDTVEVVFVPLEPHTVSVVAQPASLPADGHSTTVITATVTDEYAHPVTDGTPVTFAASLGVITPTTSATVDGVVTATLTSSLDLGVAVITATTGEVSGTVEVALVPLEPHTVTVQTAAASLPADGRSATIITATVTDEYGHPVAPGTWVTFAASLGTLAPEGGTVHLPPHGQSASDGVVTTTLTTGLEVGIAQVTATAGGVTGTVAVAFVPLEPYTISVTAHPATLPADGVSTALLTATVTDRYAHIVADSTLVTWTATLGVVSPLTAPPTGGVVTAPFTVGRTPGRASVSVTAGQAQGSVWLDVTARIYLPLVLRW